MDMQRQQLHPIYIIIETITIFIQCTHNEQQQQQHYHLQHQHGAKYRQENRALLDT